MFEEVIADCNEKQKELTNTLAELLIINVGGAYLPLGFKGLIRRYSASS
jgi:hypothetical protein